MIVLAVLWGTGLAAGCGAAASSPETSPTAALLVFDDPPARRETTPPPAPTEDAIWAEGHWAWRPEGNGGRWAWVEGRWLDEKPGHVYVQPHWERHGRGWLFVRGHWLPVR